MNYKYTKGFRDGASSSEDIVNDLVECMTDCCRQPTDQPYMICSPCLRNLIIYSTLYQSMRRDNLINSDKHRECLKDNQEVINKIMEWHNLDEPPLAIK